VLRRPDAIAIASDTVRVPASPVDTLVVNLHNDNKVVIIGRLSRRLSYQLREHVMGKDPPAQRVNDTETAGVIARPPLLFLTALVLGHAADHVLPSPFGVPGTGTVRWIVAGVLILGGIALAAAGIRDFSRAGTPVPTNEPTRALVTSGAHGWSRNPIYIGMFSIYAGAGVADRSPWILILALPLAITIRYGVVAREEAYLERRFGDVYRDYKSRVRRWL
jgi:protein-S-isoprenylcysteine O-methyltransferase Ste14